MHALRRFSPVLFFVLAACGGGVSGPGPLGVVSTPGPGTPATAAPASTPTAPGGTSTAAATPTAAAVSMTTATPSAAATGLATAAPATSNPATAAPGSPTTAPATSGPATTAPTTSAPVTSAPATSVPATSAPATSSPATPTPAPTAATTATKIGHVFTVVLENESEAVTYATTAPVATYLNNNVKPAGVFIPGYYATGHASLDNYISMISGQAPNVNTSADCQVFLDNTPAAATTTDGQLAGEGCIFPTSVPNLADQLMAAGITWKSYDEDMGNDPSRESATCGHPTVNAQDGTQSAEGPSAANNNMGDQYATRHNPFMYFHSIIDNQAYCNAHVVNSTVMATDLQSIATTPQFSFYTPNLCDDGHDSPCATGQAGGLVSIDAFMRMYVPMITSSPAFQKDGLLIVIFDESSGDDTACCGEMPGPTDPEPGEEGAGGGATGAVLISPFITPGSVSMTQYNHYSMLRSVEDLFGLSHIGYAQQSGLASFGPDVYNSMAAPSSRYRQVIRYGARR